MVLCGRTQVTYRDPESARRACENPNPVIDGRRANCNIASLGRPRPSPPRGTQLFCLIVYLTSQTLFLDKRTTTF